jgi:hypothetical protein
LWPLSYCTSVDATPEIWRERYPAMLRNCRAKPLIATLMFSAVSATAAAMDRGQFKDVPPAIREWFENMRSPKGIRVALTLMVTALATTSGKVNIGFPSMGSGIRYRQRP